MPVGKRVFLTAETKPLKKTPAKIEILERHTHPVTRGEPPGSPIFLRVRKNDQNDQKDKKDEE